MLVQAGKKRADEWEKYEPPVLVGGAIVPWIIYEQCRYQQSRLEWWDEKRQERRYIQEIRAEAISAMLDILDVPRERRFEVYEDVRFIERTSELEKRRYAD